MSGPFVVVGGDAAGMSAASKARREYPDLDIVVFEKGEWVSYGACGLPYYVKGEIDDLSDLVSVTAEEFRTERDIDLRTNHEVTAVDPEEKTVTVETEGETFDQPYETLLIATGAHAIVPPIDGVELSGIHTLHSLPAGKAIRETLEDVDQRPETVGIVGGGYVGIEMAEAFRGRDVDVHLFEMLPHVLQPFGEMVAETVEAELRDHDVTLHLGTEVDGFDGEESVSGIRTDEGTVPVDMVLLGVGVAPNVELAREAGIEIGDTGAIASDEYGRTSDPSVFAAGDCAEMNHVVTGEPDYVPLALTANRAGRAIGRTVTGTNTPVGEIAGTAAVKAFDLQAARTGILDESRAREAGFDPVSATITSASRAGYYPGGSPVKIKLVGDRDTENVLGASMVGEEGIAKRVDTIATALHSDLTVSDVEYLDLSYAPPFGPTWDPVLTAAKVLSGKIE
ncbi:MAG: FAD-dependent oxidoreductase [Halodesulfurarchaeum sp.]